MGVNWTDPAHYGSTNNLNACVNDAVDMRRIARNHNIHGSLLTDEHATTANVLADIRRAAQTLNAGDLFVLTYSGHGANVDDESGDELSVNGADDGLDSTFGSNDGSDETLCLHDRMLIDDELYLEFKRFKEGVRILAIFDCCHSGTAVRSIESAESRALDYSSKAKGDEPPTLDLAAGEIAAFLGSDEVASARSGRSAMAKASGPPPVIRSRQRTRTFPTVYNRKVNDEHREIYRDIQRDVLKQTKAENLSGEAKAAVLLLAACQDSQLAREEGSNGLFTRAIKVTLEPLELGPTPYSGTYKNFLEELKLAIGAPAQVPNLYTAGTKNEAFFDLQTPFQLA